MREPAVLVRDIPGQGYECAAVVFMGEEVRRYRDVGARIMAEAHVARLRDRLDTYVLEELAATAPPLAPREGRPNP